MTHWYLQPIFENYALVLVVTASLLALLAMRPTFGDLSARQRFALGSLRAAMVFVLLLTMLQPSCVSTTTRRQTSLLMFLVDQTRSMRQPLEAVGKTRFEVEIDAVKRLEPILAKLGPGFEVQCYAYDTEAHLLEFDGKTVKWPSEASGVATDIGASLAEAVARAQGKRLAAVFLFGDGVQTRTRVDSATAAQEVARLQAPLYTTAFGPSSDESQAKDVAIVSMPEQFTVFVNAQLTVKALVQIRGYKLQDLKVELFLEDAAGKRERVGERTVKATGDDQQVPVEFTYQPKQIGQYQLTVQIEEQPGEITTINNRMSAYLNVMEGGLRVLYLAGELWGEQLRLRRALETSPEIHIDFVWIDHRNSKTWPLQSVIDRIATEEYDVYILDNVHASALRSVAPDKKDGLTLLAERVEKGKSLLVIGGEHSYGPGDYASTRLADVLPVVMDPLEKQNIGEPVRPDVHLPGPLAISPVVPGDPITTLAAATTENAAVWKKLPPLDGANKFIRVKERATVLLKGPKGEPLLVAGEAVGRVLAFAGDSTWKWWGRGYQNEHKRLWRQVILWLAHRQDEEKTDVWLRLDSRRLKLAQKLVYTAGVRTNKGDPVAGADFKAVLKGPDGKESPLALAANGAERKGTYEALQGAGRFTIEVSATKDGKPLGSSHKEFEVVDDNPEETILSADPDHFARLSALTREYGGKLLPAESLSEVLQEIQRKPPDTEEEVLKKWQLAGGTADAWGVFLVLVALLSTEWWLRKRWGLV